MFFLFAFESKIYRNKCDLIKIAFINLNKRLFPANNGTFSFLIVIELFESFNYKIQVVVALKCIPILKIIKGKLRHFRKYIISHLM